MVFLKIRNGGKEIQFSPFLFRIEREVVVVKGERKVNRHLDWKGVKLFFIHG